MASLLKSPEEFSLVVICPLEVEALAVIAQLDQDKEFGEHSIVVTSLPPGRQGHSSAAVAAQQTVAKFPRLTCVLLVGIAGGVPSDKNDIRLGDVVVSFPCGKYGGVVQYDFGKDEQQFEHNGHTNSVPQQLLVYLRAVQINHRRSHHNKPKYLKYLDDQISKGLIRKPDVDTDRLFPASYAHQGGPDCTTCDETQAQRREAREDPRIHYGLIASGNRVMKNAEMGDKPNKAHGGIVLAYEMEAAGLMNFTPCLVIRGISDYADSHKPPGDEWHAHAATATAAYAREFIEKVPVEKFASMPNIADQS
ncbi:purine and uridine phosphorylase [Glonium stellatum]|uniref:Purine and uridine phosphorylase n=1 Tax=Glonium stellatum TaxID=574774 RepID=A0A8E2FAI4_9PEZI|nr:purine and uridine phosphorylase [Glonium stellatum]